MHRRCICVVVLDSNLRLFDCSQFVCRHFTLHTRVLYQAPTKKASFWCADTWINVHMLINASITFLKTLTQCHKNKIKTESSTANALESSKKKGKEEGESAFRS